MLINDAIGRLGVQLTREASQSALPHAPMIDDRRSTPAAFRIRTAAALHRLADRISPVDTPAGHRPLAQS
jgi:hypothetical protein